MSAPNVRSEAPSQASSETSRRAAECVSEPFRRRSHRLILTALAAGGRSLASMHDISVITDIPVHTVSARLNDLVPLWVECVEGACRSHVKPSLSVNGYTLTSLGLQRWMKANEPLALPLEGAA